MTSSSNTFVDRVSNNKDGPPLGTILTLPSVTIAQLTAQAASELIMIDMEHAPLTIDIVTQMVHAYSAAGRSKHALIRIPSHGVEWVKWGLDSGAAGIIVPMVSNADEMKAIMDRAIYPPGGRRSFGPIYAQFASQSSEGGAQSGVGGMAAYFERARRGEIALIPMIESKEGLSTVDEILALEHVDGCLIGPADLRLSLGLSPGLDGDESEFRDAVKKIIGSAKKHGKVVGTVAMGDGPIKNRVEEGIDFLFTGFDFGALVSGLSMELEASKKSVQEAFKDS